MILMAILVIVYRTVDQIIIRKVLTAGQDAVCFKKSWISD